MSANRRAPTGISSHRTVAGRTGTNSGGADPVAEAGYRELQVLDKSERRLREEVRFCRSSTEDDGKGWRWQTLAPPLASLSSPCALLDNDERFVVSGYVLVGLA